MTEASTSNCYQIRPTYRNILSTHIFSIKSFCLLLIFEAHLVTICYKCVCVVLFFFFTPWYHMFVWHYPKASSRWKRGRRNNPVPKGQMNSLGRKERGRKCSVLPRSARVHTAHSSSVPLASDCSWERKVGRVEGRHISFHGKRGTVEAWTLSMLRSAQPTIPRQCLPAALAVCHFGFWSLWQTVSIFIWALEKLSHNKRKIAPWMSARW